MLGLRHKFGWRNPWQSGVRTLDVSVSMETGAEAEGKHRCQSQERRKARDRTGTGRKRGSIFPSVLESEGNTASNTATVSTVF